MLSLPVDAFLIFVSPVAVVEYHNVLLNHYFLTADPAEIVAIEAGSAGPGWSRTGLGFSAYPAKFPGATMCPVFDCGQPVSRFYGTPGLGPNSHFYTADPVEANGLKQPGSGWTFEREEFSIPVPDANGQCGAFLVPVYRFYNNRFMFNDSNHRYVTDAGERAKMVALGWIDEGVRFCTYNALHLPVKSYVMSIPLPAKIQPSAVCEDESQNLGPCLALNNLEPPATPYPPAQASLMPPDFAARTGVNSSFDFVRAPPVGPILPAVAASDVFVQDAGPNALGIHVDTAGRGPSQYSSVNPLYQFHTNIAPGAFDDRFFPWAPRESEMELDVRFTLNVKTLNVRGDGSAAIGHPTIEFIDRQSGHHLYFTVLTYGSVAATDYLAPDVVTGKTIVGTTFRADSPFIRSLGLPTLPTPSGFVAPNPWGWGGAFEFRMATAEFQRVLDAARSVDATLSPAPTDYFVDNFHFNNEVYGDGEIGVNIAGFTMELARR